MSDTTTRILPPGFVQGPVQGLNIIGEVTESLHRYLLDGWTFTTPPPRVEEDLSFVPKDREEVLYVYMYRAAQNTSLMNSKQWRPAKVSTNTGSTDGENIFYERAPLYLNLFYMIAIHSKFRSDAERLMGWLLMRLYDATHLVYRPRKYILPDGSLVDSTGAPWKPGVEGGDDLIMEKVSLNLVDDLTIGDAINFFTINEAPYRPYLTYRAQCAMEGSLVSGPPTRVAHHRTRLMQGEPSDSRPNGRISGTNSPSGSSPAQPKMHIGPPGFGHRPIEDNESED
ncbi:MAG: Pvc16 family protein [Myxococcota bacterium]